MVSCSITERHLLRLLSFCSNLKHVHQFHAFILSTGLHHRSHLLSRFLHTSASLGFSHYSFSVLTHLNATATHPPPPSTLLLLFNTIINASLPSSPTYSLFLFNTIQLSGLRPDSYSFPFALKAVVRLSAIRTGRQIHCQSVLFGLHSHAHVASALVHMYSSCPPYCILDARKVFDEICALTEDVPLWNSMLAAYSKAGQVDNARSLFQRMPQKNVISWTTMITGYAQASRSHEAIGVFRRMQLEGVEPDAVALLVALSACSHLGALELGDWIHNYIDKHGLHTHVPLSNALIDMYAKSGNIGRALCVFENVNNKSIVTWTTMISGLALHGLGAEALEMFSRMERAKVKPNDVTFIAVLSACAHIGLVEVGRQYFKIMRSNYGIEPKIEHYGCVIDLLGRAGNLQEAQELLVQMPFEANAAIWGSLLAASSIHGNATLGERALRQLIKFEPNNSGNYALLCNIYASLGRWNESRMLRKVMRDMGVRKIPGGSLIEVNNRVHEFIAGETSHSDFHRIHEALSQISGELGPVANLEKDCICGEDILGYSEG